MVYELLLKEDVESLGKKGQVVRVKPGYGRNYLIPQGKAMIADKNTLRVQKRLQKERDEQALQDRKEAQTVADALNGAAFEMVVKVDSEGHLYGSVAALDIVHTIEKEKGIVLEKKNIFLKEPIKKLGEHLVVVRLKEDISCSIELNVVPEEKDLSA